MTQITGTNNDENADNQAYKTVKSELDSSSKNNEGGTSSAVRIGAEQTSLRRRQNNQSNTTGSHFFPRSSPRWRFLSSRAATCVFAGILVLVGLLYYRFHLKTTGRPNPNSPFSHFARVANNVYDTGMSFQPPEHSVMGKYRVVFRDLAVTVGKGILAENGARIAQKLYEIADEARETEQTMREFRHAASKFFHILFVETNAIASRVEDEKWSLFSSFEFKFKLSEKLGMFGGHLTSTDETFIQDRLSGLEEAVTTFRDQLKRIMDAVVGIENSATYTLDYLLSGEREAQEAIKKYWQGRLADYDERKRAELEFKRLQHAIKMLREMAPNLGQLWSFLDDYRVQLLDIKTEIKKNRRRLKPSGHDIRYLRESAEKLKKIDERFEKQEERLGDGPHDTYYLDDDINARHRDCVEFHLPFNKPGAHLRRIRIWSSSAINALGFFYSDDSVEIYGNPGSGSPRDFAWTKGEKIASLEFSFGAVIYGLQISTSKDRTTGWHGGQEGNRVITKDFVNTKNPHMYGGLHGSYANYLCSIGLE